MTDETFIEVELFDLLQRLAENSSKNCLITSGTPILNVMGKQRRQNDLI